MSWKSMMLNIVLLVLAVMFHGSLIMIPSSAEAKVVAVEGVSYNVGADMKDNLKSLVGKKVQVTVASGNTITGLVKDVGDHLVHIGELDGNELFDALIRIDNISAISTRFRMLQR